MPDFSVRSTQDELMDDPAAPEAALRQNLRELEVVNEYLGGYRVILNALKKLDLPEPHSLMDLGSGGGDTLRAIAAQMRKHGLRGKLTGIDYNPVMNKYAAEHSINFPEIQYRTLDIFDAQLLEERPVIVTCSLFCHHFEHRSLVALIKRMQLLAGKAVIINDLHRHWLAYYSIKFITALFSKTYMVKNDAPLSVARAFTRKDWQQIMADAGITDYQLSWRWAFRWLVVIKKNGA